MRQIARTKALMVTTTRGGIRFLFVWAAYKARAMYSGLAQRISGASPTVMGVAMKPALMMRTACGLPVICQSCLIFQAYGRDPGIS